MPFSSLRAIGFTDSDIATYELLVKEGDNSREELLKKSGLKKEKFDEIVSHLLSYGAIEVSGNTVSSVSPKAFLHKYLRRKELDQELQLAELRNSVNGIESILEHIYAERRLGIRLEELWQIIDGLAAMEMETVRIISRSRSEICILAEQFNWFPKVREEIISALDRKVKVRVMLLAVNEDMKEKIEEMKRLGFQVRQAPYEWRSTRFTIVDTSELIFLVWARKSGESRVYFRPGYTKNPGLVCVFQDSFELLWEKAKKL